MLADIVIGGGGIGSLLIWVIVIAACVAVALVALRQFGVSIPSWAMTVLWICVVAVVAIFAIRFLMTL